MGARSLPWINIASNHLRPAKPSVRLRPGAWASPSPQTHPTKRVTPVQMGPYAHAVNWQGTWDTLAVCLLQEADGFAPPLHMCRLPLPLLPLPPSSQSATDARSTATLPASASAASPQMETTQRTPATGSGETQVTDTGAECLARVSMLLGNLTPSCLSAAAAGGGCVAPRRLLKSLCPGPFVGPCCPFFAATTAPRAAVFLKEAFSKCNTDAICAPAG